MVATGKTTLQCSKLYIGDPCIVLDGDLYDQICSGDDFAIVPDLGICHSTGIGDGQLEDGEGYVYSVDSGQIAVLNGDKADLSVPENATAYDRIFIQSLNVIDVPSGKAEIQMEFDNEDNSLQIRIEDSDGSILYNSTISVEDYEEEDEDNED